MANGRRKAAGTRGGGGRLLAMAVALAAGLLLALADQARAIDPTVFTPLGLQVEGGSEWRQANDYDVFWANPFGGQVVGADWRIYSASGYDSGAQFTPGFGLTELRDLRLPAAGSYGLLVWLRDASGFELPSLAAEVKLRLDDVAPAISFLPGGAPAPAPPRLVAYVADPLSGVVDGTISYRGADQTRWSDLPSTLAAGALGTELTAATPQLEPGATYLLRAEARDAAGNVAETTVRVDGAPATVGPGAGAGGAAGSGGSGGTSGSGGGDRGRGAGSGPTGAGAGSIRLQARLVGGRRHGGGAATLTVDAGERVMLTGRLSDDGSGVAGQRLRVVSRPARGAHGGRTVATATSGPRGSFRLPLAPGPSRRIVVVFAGGDGLTPARRRLTLRVRGAVSLRAARTRLRTGEVLRLSGRVGHRGARVPRPGKLVTISYRERETHRWRPVLVTRTDRAGRFHASYRFRYVSGRARILLRATAPAEAAWPYAPGSSRPLSVEVRG